MGRIGHARNAGFAKPDRSTDPRVKGEEDCENQGAYQERDGEKIMAEDCGCREGEGE